MSTGGEGKGWRAGCHGDCVSRLPWFPQFSGGPALPPWIIHSPHTPHTGVCAWPAASPPPLIVWGPEMMEL